MRATRKAVTSLVLGAMMGITAPAAGLAQEPRPADAALRACGAAVKSGNENAAKRAAADAEREYRSQISEQAEDVEAHVLLARVLVQCKLPFASMMGQGRLAGESSEVLEQALAIDSTHWMARYTLAMNHFHTPAFLGRTADAIREFEVLVRQQGSRADNPMFAESYLRLGDLFLRRKRTGDAVEVWRKGSALFPQHAALRERLQAHDVAIAPTGAAVDSSTMRPTYALEGLVVTASAVRMDDPRSGVAVRRLDVLTTPGGAADLMNALQTAPGTTAAAEGSDLYVRGGDPSEVPVWLDGARLHYAGRYETLNGSAFGILDPAVLKSAFFASGGFSARYGNALSGVLDVETEGRPMMRTGHVALNSAQAGGSFQLPLGETLGVWGALRATDATAMLAMHGRGDDFAVAPRAFEGMGAAVWEPRSGTRLKATVLMDTDETAREVDAWGFNGAFRSRGENRLAALSGRLMSGDGRAVLRTSVSATSRISDFTFGVLERERTDHGTTGRVDAELGLGARGRLRVGIEASALDAEHQGMFPRTDDLAPGSPADRHDEIASASHVGGYLETELAAGSRFGVVAGLRADRLPGEDEWTADPRFAVGYRAADWTLRLGGGVFHQGRWRTRYAVPDSLSPAGTPRSAAHLVVGAERQGEPAVKVEAYFKDYGQYVATGDGPRIIAGQATGADAIVRWSKQQRLNGWITYSLLHGRVELDDGRVAPSAVDVTHSLTGVAKLTLPSAWQLGTTARIATGRPYTAAEGEPNGDRLPAYQRLDARITRFWSVRSGMLVTYMEMLNVLDHANVMAYTSGGTREQRAIPAFFADRTAVFGFSLSF
ncbi:MAG: TonB-dependent receptor [Gemmatimonadetes bacterium]|nr:TonB-dependent receptor [Gemmatimonadota bacterium]